jgi:nitrate/TMAO reductase-like tetraheme cytochrome c subunit
MRRRRGVRVLAAAAAAGAVAASGGWVLTDRLEQENDFCNACHLSPGVALHRDVRRDFDAPTPASLAAAHAAAGNDARDDGAFRCIDCHGGVSLAGRVRVKLLAAQDAFWWVVGSFEEPDGMRWPLWDEDCLQCHPRFDERAVESWETPRFHQLPVHNVDLGVDCVECHLSHEAGVRADAHFLHAVSVRTQCARCHPEFEEGGT